MVEGIILKKHTVIKADNFFLRRFNLVFTNKKKAIQMHDTSMMNEIKKFFFGL